MHKDFIADFHIHSKYAHATSKFMDLSSLSLWAQLKGIAVMGTGDFTHPLWQRELKDQLQETQQGLFELRPALKEAVTGQLPMLCQAETQKFLLSGEISTVFKRNGRCYRTHSIILAPDFLTVEKITARLSKIGNLLHDGRPILSLDVKDLLKIVLDASPEAMLIPAHIWTPWYGLLGSKSGFSSVLEAFGELTEHIHAVETGLSSSFLMNAMLSELDRFALLCNSDAHSLQNLGREANVLSAPLSYDGITKAMRLNKPGHLIAGIEFFPERGKYYGDGHRACGVYYTPDQTMKAGGLCLVCRKPVTVGVLSRVQQLADRTVSQAADAKRKSFSVMPLLDILELEFGVASSSKKVQKMYHAMLAAIGNEFYILLVAPVEEIAAASSQKIAEMILLMRRSDLIIEPGYDGVYGKIDFRK